MGAWSDFFVAELGAAAALAGLVMVAISINLARILDDPGLPGRAAETLVAPSGVLVVIGLLMMVAPVAVIARLLRRKLSVGPGYIAGRVLLAAFSCVPFVVSGALLMASAPAALYWLVPGVIVSLVATVLNAWVLLVEILR